MMDNHEKDQVISEALTQQEIALAENDKLR
jgi:hypothetical protein